MGILTQGQTSYRYDSTITWATFRYSSSFVSYFFWVSCACIHTIPRKLFWGGKRGPFRKLGLSMNSWSCLYRGWPSPFISSLSCFENGSSRSSERIRRSSRASDTAPPGRCLWNTSLLLLFLWYLSNLYDCFNSTVACFCCL